MIDRRHWLAAAAGLAGTAWHASSQALPPHIGCITNLPPATLLMRAVFTEAMRERDWIDGTNYVLEELHDESLASLVA